MSDIKELRDITLVPVMELEPSTFAAQSRQTPRDDWDSYWSDSLADAGITGLRPIHPASWHVATIEFRDDTMLEQILRIIIAGWDGVETLLDPDCDPVLSGGLPLLDHDGAVLVEPHSVRWRDLR